MASAIAKERLLTAEEYGDLPDSGKPTELVRGRVIEMNFPFSRHSAICSKIAAALHLYVLEHDIGRVMSESAVRTERGPDTIRGADVAFLSYQRRPKGPITPRTYIEEVPEIVFEVRSPSDRWPPLMAKVAEYLQAGVQYVCVVEDQPEVIRVFTADGPRQVLDVNSTLIFPDILPGFTVRVGQFFE